MTNDDAPDKADVESGLVVEPARTDRVHGSRRLRLSLLALLVVAVGGLAGLRWYQRSHLDWKPAETTWVAVSPNRKVIAVYLGKYYSGSCTRLRTTLDKHRTHWSPGVEVAKTQDFCTAELGISQYVQWDGESGVPMRKSIPDDVGGDPGIVVIHLTSPVPEGVTVSLD